ncbi:MAG: phosphonoacetaldehyde reductase [Hespellia sp.]|nr:phosphonoacetaldehyde reductase [Hespellia sp.]
MNETVIEIKNNEYSVLEQLFIDRGYKNILLVCGRSIERLQINKFFCDLEDKGVVRFVRFSDFQPNPKYESVVNGIKVYKEKLCDAILAVGGGSAMDVAKCIKLFLNMDHRQNYLKQEIVANDIPLLAVPTTSGTGSEATRFAVIYYDGEKQSVSDYSCIPSVVVFDPSVLSSVPDYQRKATMLDAFCHAIESFWSVNSTEESKKNSKLAIKQILENMDSYFANDSNGNACMLEASNNAGKAINITQTTAGHAMCYKLTSLYGLSHGHAAALCISKIWPYMIENTDKCIDSRGEGYLKIMFNELAGVFCCTNSMEAANRFNCIVESLNLSKPYALPEELEELKNSVNMTRLKNNPIMLDAQTIELLYRKIIEVLSEYKKQI